MRGESSTLCRHCQCLPDLVVGSAYGPFIGGDGRPHEIEPSEYAFGPCVEFGRIFFEKIIGRRRYYAKLGEIALSVVGSCSLAALFDLCRVVFVRRITEPDEGGDGVANSAPELFNKYVESPIPNGWLWRRVIRQRSEHHSGAGHCRRTPSFAPLHAKSS
jgi:hypothetical protein